MQIIEFDRGRIRKGDYLLDTRNEIKSYIVREGMTMSEVVVRLANDYGWSSSVSNLSGNAIPGIGGVWPMCWAMSLFGRNARGVVISRIKYMDISV